MSYSISIMGKLTLRITARGDRLPSDWGFRLMALGFKVRDFLKPRQLILEETGIRPGYHVLDFGCGPGSYVAATAGLVGNLGKVYALDAHPLAIEMVKNLISKKHLTSVQTILSECPTGLPDNSLDVVLLYDILHDLGGPDSVLMEIRRVLKPAGLLSVNDHHLKEGEIFSRITQNGLFKLSHKGKMTINFVKQ
jgi:ubiquinone/menaquinone biosynthesis C-methylase UbiE